MKKLSQVLALAVLCPFLLAGGRAIPAPQGAISVEHIRCGANNCYIVSQGERAILVDTATAQYRDTILKKCRAQNVRLIVLTHGHYDHAQNAAWLARELGVPIAMHTADLPVLEEMPVPKAHTLLGWIMAGAMWLQVQPGLRAILSWLNDNTVPAFETDILLKDGDSLAAFGVDATVIELPGHTLGSIGLKVGDSLLVGDALMNILWPQKSLHYLDSAAMERSAEKISGYGSGVTVYFGHGDPVPNRNW